MSSTNLTAVIIKGTSPNTSALSPYHKSLLESNHVTPTSSTNKKPCSHSAIKNPHLDCSTNTKRRSDLSTNDERQGIISANQKTSCNLSANQNPCNLSANQKQSSLVMESTNTGSSLLLTNTNGKSSPTKSQKRKLRRKMAKSKGNLQVSAFREVSAKHHGFKYNSPIIRRLHLYRNSFCERISKKFFCKTLNPQDVLAQWTQDISSMQVGLEFKEASGVLQSAHFTKPLKEIIKRFGSLNLASMLNHHCPLDKDNFTPSSQIHSLLRAVIFKVKLVALLGSKKNISWIETCVTRYISAPWKCEIPLGQLMQGVDLTGISWLDGVPRPLVANLLAKLLKWFLTKFVEAVVRGFFKMTDKADGKRKIFYYRKSVWELIFNKGLDRLKARSYKPLSDAYYEKFKTIPHTTIFLLRLLPKPKASEVRPIARIQTRLAGVKAQEQLYWTKRFLKEIVEKFPAKSDLSGRSLHKGWTDLLQDTAKETPLFWVATDISDAFGSIKLPVLANILRDHDTPENKSVLSDLRKKLLLNIVKVDLGGKALHFLVSRGVLQGGRLSSILSDIYYGHMTQHCLHTFTIPPEHTKELFLRGADDFLFMSTNRTRAVEFLKLISQGFPHYGCVFKHAKTRTNLSVRYESPETVLRVRLASPEHGVNTRLAIPEHDVPVSFCSPEQERFTYCGSIIDMQERSIGPTTSSFDNSNIVFAQSWPELSKEIGVTIVRNFRYYCGQRLRPLYFNKTNSKKACLKNLATNVYIAVKRLTAMLDVMIVSRGRKIQEGWLWLVVMTGLRRFTPLHRHTQLTPVQIRWVCLRTLILQLKPNIFPARFIGGIKNLFTKTRNTIHYRVEAELELIVLDVPKRIPHLRASSKWK